MTINENATCRGIELSLITRYELHGPETTDHEYPPAPARQENYFFSVARKTDLESFLAFFAARFSFKDMTGFFMASLLGLRSFDMANLRIRGGWY